MPVCTPSFSQGRGPIAPQAFYVPFVRPPRYTITGVTKDSTGAILGNCAVNLFETSTQLIKATTISDVNGNYLLDGTVDGIYQIHAYKSGSPDVAGATINTLVTTPA